MPSAAAVPNQTALHGAAQRGENAVIEFLAQKGAKRVMLKNFQHAKFDNVLVPISQHVLAKEDQSLVGFEPFFTHILAHELMHGLGPHQITINGRETNPRLELKEVYSAIEEAKADTETNTEKRKARYQANSADVKAYYRVNSYPR